jgi:multicomponent Na+:H+ antiporter subunit E
MDVPRFLARVAMLALLWWVLTEGRGDSWLVGAPVVVFAAAVSWRLVVGRRGTWSAAGIARFVLFFLRSSFVGGIDVAARAIHPRLPIDPRIVDYRLRTRDERARVFFMGVLNLLPGTVTVDVRGEMLLVHVIDVRRPVQRQLEELEMHVAAIFGSTLDSSTEKGTPG